MASRRDRSTTGVRFEPHGVHDPAREIIGAADLFLHTSRSAALPLPLIRALALGVPTIASHVGGIPLRGWPIASTTGVPECQGFARLKVEPRLRIGLLATGSNDLVWSPREAAQDTDGGVFRPFSQQC